ncbi:LacI family DNA-binding transcriptional regulator [Arthrobacter sp. zg-Y769]|uniref:LacI family DNA-binding transcriptional regulator n=1 Tax=Arthrobacter sp. zg-Y769 TaxID=2894191 RepID=UPI001E2FA241|nr:LacI family DNA-binding transcriptional regulator [Arthrobacter sp. zg-Y769]MCC9205576.1 LacI family transcriptional regulator [Arthrobacter sp. zg-Y769]
MVDSGEVMGRLPTIRDIAARAGVAVSTVSRALSNPARVSTRTREKIERIAAELEYVPSTQARSLSSGRTGTVALLVPDVTNPFYFDIVRGTQAQLKAGGYTQLLVDTEEATDVELQTLQRLRRSTDGIILAASRLTDQQLTGVAHQHPLVTINRPSADAPTVLLDTAEVMVQAIDHLASLGHTSVAYAAGPVSSWSNHRRWHAIEQAALKRNMVPHRLGPYAPKRSSGAAAADAALGAKVTAVIAFNDLLAIGMLQRLAERGVGVPRDISLVGCDDIFGADFCNPPLTTISCPIEQAGRVAVSMLMAQLNPLAGSTLRKMAKIPGHLVIRSSTGDARQEA